MVLKSHHSISNLLIACFAQPQRQTAETVLHVGPIKVKIFSFKTMYVWIYMNYLSLNADDLIITMVLKKS